MTPFDSVERSPRGHASLLLNLAAFRIATAVRRRAAAQGRGASEMLREFPFLADYLAQLQPLLPPACDPTAAVRALESALAEWESSVDAHLPLRATRSNLRLGPDGLLAFLSAAIVDEDARFGDLYATLQPASQSRRPSIALVQEFLQSSPAGCWTVCRRAVESGLVEVLNPDAARADWTLRVPSLIWSAALGEALPQSSSLVFLPHAELTPAAELILPEAQRQRVAAIPALLKSSQSRTLVIRGLPGCDRVAVAGAAAHGLGLSLLTVDRPLEASNPVARQLGALAVLTHALPVFIFDLAAGDTAQLPALDGYEGPAAAIAGLEGGIGGPLAEHAITLALSPDSADERTEHWRRALNGHSGGDPRIFAERFFIPGRYIRQSAHLAASYAALDGREHVTVDDVRLSSRAINRQVLDPYAERLDSTGHWNQLVVPEFTRVELTALENRCRCRERLAHLLSPAMPGGLNRGVRALFEGPSGTGKTLGARILAGQLGLDIYRVDLASVVNKYIGETEKNLSRILSRAEDLDVVLLLDEGDSLMSRRTDVKSSNDRYANLETNYLLQRLETYTGIVIITTNFGQHIDTAFRRRIDAVLRFPLPDPPARLRLWQLHLPAGHAIADEELEQLSIRHALTGAQIRNAAVNASLGALARPGSAIAASDLVDSIRIEYRKSGAALPPDFTSRSGVAPANGAAIVNAIF
jgi:hypothetical protein